MNPEIDILGIIEMIFTGEAKHVKYYTLDFGISDKRELFELLLMIFTYSTKKLYGDSNGIVNLKNMSENDMLNLKKYYNSFGIELYTNVYNEIDYLNSGIKTYKEINIDKNNKLEDLIFSINCQETIYTISFSLI